MVWFGCVVAAQAVMTLGLAAPAFAGRCEDAATARDVNAALEAIEASADPCGESAAVIHVVREFRRCAKSGYRVCLDLKSERNYIDPGPKAGGFPTTITWNPELRTELERGCGGEAQRVVLRDPYASLLHEVVHAVQDCHGLDPVEHEFEAVRIENIYRRASGLCQRTRYGDSPLPSKMVVNCDPDNCRCTPTQSIMVKASDDAEPGVDSTTGAAAADAIAQRR